MNINEAKRIVIKIGTGLVTENGNPRTEWLASLAEDIHRMQQRGQQIVIVSSGALSLGKKLLPSFTHKDMLRIEEKQAASAYGQSELIQTYRHCLDKHDIRVGQILLSLDDTENRRRYLNARNTIETLLKNDVVPVINENDSVATLEIRFGDNDRLAARVAQMVEADLLVLFSDIDGLYSSSPKQNNNAEHIAIVDEITPEIEAMAGKPDSQHGSGGMVTKLMAAKIAVNSGCNMIIALGEHHHPITSLENGDRHTLFLASDTPHSARKSWIAHKINPAGNVTIDEGAANALGNGNSLLPIGVVSLDGNFDRGDCIIIKSTTGEEIGRGLTAYSSQDAEKIIGHNTSDIEKILGFSGRDALIHNDDLVLS